MSRIPKAVVNAVWKRAGFDGFLDGTAYCEACGGPIGSMTPALHHRLPLSAGGANIAENLMLVHGDFGRNCHNLTEYSIHQNPERSYRLGHMLRRGQDPLAAPPPTVATDLITLRA